MLTAPRVEQITNSPALAGLSFDRRGNAAVAASATLTTASDATNPASSASSVVPSAPQIGEPPKNFPSGSRFLRLLKILQPQ
jgi:hypothetical protein